MSDSLVVFPYDGSEEVRDWLTGLGVVPPTEVGTLPERALVESILRQADWPFQSSERDDIWEADFESREERWPPIQCLSLHSAPRRFLGFRLGPLYGPYVVVREVAQVCRAQIAVTGSMGSPCVVVPETTYEEFHEALLECPPPADRKDREWSEPPTEEWKYANASPEEWASAPEGMLDYALSGRRGHATAATAVGQALQMYRVRDQGGPLPRDPLDATRYAALVARLTAYVRSAQIPAPALVWALGQAPEARDELTVLAERLEDVDGAEEARHMAELFLGRDR